MNCIHHEHMFCLHSVECLAQPDDLRSIINAAAESLKTAAPWKALDLAQDLDDGNGDGGETNVEIYVHQTEPEGEEDAAAHANSGVKEQRQLLNNELQYRHQQGCFHEADQGSGVLLYNDYKQEKDLQWRERQLDFKVKRAGFPVRNCSPNILRFKDGLYKVIQATPAQSATILTPLLQATLYHAPATPPPLRATTASHQAGAEADAECDDSARDDRYLPASETAHHDHEPRDTTSVVLDASGSNDSMVCGEHREGHDEGDVPRCLAASAEPEWREAHVENDPRISTTPDCVMMSSEADVLFLQPSVVNPSFSSEHHAANVVQVPAHSVVRDSACDSVCHSACDTVTEPEVLRQANYAEFAVMSDRCIPHDHSGSAQQQHVAPAQLLMRPLAASGVPVLPPALPCFMDSKRREVHCAKCDAMLMCNWSKRSVITLQETVQHRLFSSYQACLICNPLL